jgi:hypothetical protein
MRRRNCDGGRRLKLRQQRTANAADVVHSLRCPDVGDTQSPPHTPRCYADFLTLLQHDDRCFAVISGGRIMHPKETQYQSPAWKDRRQYASANFHEAYAGC